MNDEKIIELYFDRDESAIKETKNKYGRYVFKIAYNILAHKEDAEESENDTYMAAWNSIPPEKPNILVSFLGKITRNLSLKKLRSKTAEKRGGSSVELCLEELSECIPDTKSFKDEIETRELAEILNGFLESLDATSSKIFVLRYWYCESIKDICRRFMFTESKVKMALKRTREKLLDYLQDEEVFI